MSAREIPNGWIETKIASVVEAPIVYGILQPGPQDANGVPYIRPSEIDGDRIQIADLRRTSPEIAAKYHRSSLRAGDVVLSIVGTIGKVAIVPPELAGANITQSSARIRLATKALLPEFAAYALRSPFLIDQFNQARLGTAVPRLNLADVRELTLCVAPLPEQRRIVEAIESYFTRLDDAVATLERVQRNLKRYRASVLKAAVEGRLVPTEAELARAKGGDYEPATALLDRILAERRRASQSPEDLPAVPEGWAWATLGELAEVMGGITKGQKPRPGARYREVPYLRVANVQRGYLDLSVMKTIMASEDHIAQLRLEPGDVLFNEGGDRDKLGRGWVWKGEISECIHQNHVFRARIIGKSIVPELLSWYGNTEGQRYFYEEGKHTTNLASINMTKLRALPVPVPPRAEQLRILEAVETKLSIVDEALKTVERERMRCDRLRQSILKWAFDGRLVDQDPTDEPASVLLERIKAERAASATTTSNRKSRRKGNSANA